MTLSERFHSITPARLLLFTVISLGVGLLCAGLVAAKYNPGTRKIATRSNRKAGYI